MNIHIHIGILTKFSCNSLNFRRGNFRSFFFENVVGELDFSFYYLKWGEQAPRTSLWHLISLSSVSKVTSKKSSSFLKSWNAVDKFDVKSFHFKQYFSPSTEPMVAVTTLFNSIHITFSCQSFILKKFFFSQLDLQLLLALSESDDPVSVVSSSYAELPIGALCIY